MSIEGQIKTEMEKQGRGLIFFPADFSIIGEPDIQIVKDSEDTCHVEILGLDIYDPIKDDVKARSVEDIAYWKMDDNYDGNQFIVRSIHFCGGDKKKLMHGRKVLVILPNPAQKQRKKQNEH